jgi:hypothetical protein
LAQKRSGPLDRSAALAQAIPQYFLRVMFWIPEYGCLQ